MDEQLRIETRDRCGSAVTLVVERDRHSVFQVYARLGGEERYLCHGWGTRRKEDGFRHGIICPPHLLEVPREDWERALAVREDLRDRDNLEHIRLVKVFSRGNKLVVDGYTLSARVDRRTWSGIAPYMREVDSGVNDELLEGDHFRGWIIDRGQEETVERVLGVKPHNTLRARAEGGEDPEGQDRIRK